MVIVAGCRGQETASAPLSPSSAISGAASPTTAGPAYSSPTPNATNAVSPVVVSPGPRSPSGWKSYHHSRLGFSLMYPPTWQEIPLQGQAGEAVYLSNESVTQVGELDKHGIWLAVGVEAGYTYCYGESN